MRLIIVLFSGIVLLISMNQLDSTEVSHPMQRSMTVLAYCMDFEYETALDSLARYIEEEQDPTIRQSFVNLMVTILYLNDEFDQSRSMIQDQLAEGAELTNFDFLVTSYWLAIAEGDYGEADSLYYQIDSIDIASNPEARFHPATTAMRVEVYLHRKEYEKAMDGVEFMLTYYRPTAFKYVLLADVHIGLQQYEKAIESTQLALKSSPLSRPMIAYCNYLLAIAYYHLGNSELARDKFSKAWAISKTVTKRFLIGLSFHSLPYTELETLQTMHDLYIND